MEHHEITDIPTRLIPLGKLEKSPLNARRTAGANGIDELKASLRSHGLMQNLVVTAAPGDTYLVIAGGRRLDALRSMVAEGVWPDDYAVPCQVVSEEHALEMSLAENTVRLAMHPADEFETFAELIAKGYAASAVAERFGVDEKHVLKRMKLGRVAPELLAEYREGQLDLECLMAFTITDDRAKQIRVYESLQPWQQDDARHIRSRLTEAMVEADSKLAKFVGIEAYRAEGGTTRADLFGKEVYLENPELLQQLAVEKLDGIRQELEAEGWGWVEVSLDRDWTVTSGCSRLEPVPLDPPQELLEQKAAVEAEIDEIQHSLEDMESDELLEALDELESRLSDIESQLDSFAAFDPEQRKSAGCYVTISRDGELSVEEGLVRRQDQKKVDAEVDELPTARQAKPKGGLPESLHRDLEAYRLQAAQVEIAKHPGIAFDLLVFKVARSALGTYPVYDGPDVLFRQHHGTLAVQREETDARIALESIKDGLPAEWLNPDSEAEQFAAFRKLSDAGKQAILAYCTALTLQPDLSAEDVEASAYDAALTLTRGNMASYWRPTKDNFLGRITRDQLLSIGRETFGEHWAQARRDDKKGELVDQLDRAFRAPEEHGRTKQQVEALRNWLPAGMRFSDDSAEPELALAEAASKAA